MDWHGAAASALEWWHDAGVDILVDDAPRDWLAEPALLPAAIAASIGAPAEPLPRPVGMPDMLADFLAWRHGDGVPENSWSGMSIAASGPADATVMVLVDCPEREDGDASMLLAGAAGRLFDRMLAAIGLSRDAVHLAAVCTKRPTAGRIQSEVEATLAEISRHHVALVAPKRLLLLGNAASRAILGMDFMPARGRLHTFNHKVGQAQASAQGLVKVVASFHPRFLIEKPEMKIDAWKDLQMVIEGLA